MHSMLHVQINMQDYMHAHVLTLGHHMYMVFAISSHSFTRGKILTAYQIGHNTDGPA